MPKNRRDATKESLAERLGYYWNRSRNPKEGKELVPAAVSV